jgi:putative DNA primase/helicase
MTTSDQIVLRDFSPRALARQFVAERYSTEHWPLLAHWRGEFYRYDGAKYVVLEVERLRAQLYAFLEDLKIHDARQARQVPYQPNTRRVNDVIDGLGALVQLSIDTAPAWLETRPSCPSDLITFANGIIDIKQVLRDGKPQLIPPTPALFTLNALPFPFDAEARCERWMAFLQEVLDGDEERIGLLQEYLGYLMTQDTRQQKALLLIGLPRSGKGTVLRAVSRAIGEGNVVSLSLITLAHRFGLTPLLGRSLAICPEVHLGRGADSSLVVERLKSIIGEDAQQIDRKHLTALPSVRLTTRFVLACNEFPKLPDASAAMRSRLLPLPFHNTYEGREDFTLEEKIAGETLGIVLWGLKGLYRMRKRGHFVLPLASEHLLKQFARLSSTIQGFIEDCCDVLAGASEAVELMWTTWITWCHHNGHEPGSKNVFGAQLAAAVPGLSRARKRDEHQDRYPVYRGIRLKTQTSTECPGRP